MYILSTDPIEFIPLKFKNSENPLTFIVKPPTRKTALKLQDIILNSSKFEEDGKEAVAIPLETVMELYLDACVIGWKNIFDSNDKAIPFTKENFDLFNDIEVITELFEYCRELTAGTEKN